MAIHPILSSTSPLVTLPEGLRPDHRAWFEGIRYSVQIADVAYRRLVSVLADMVSAAHRGEKLAWDVHATCFGDAWTIVDGAYRLRELGERPPQGLAKRPESPSPSAVRYNDYIVATKHLKEMRHGIQHVDTQGPKVANDGMPVWGTLHWLTTFDGGLTGYVSLLVAGTVLPGEVAVQNPADVTAFADVVDHVQLVAFGQTAQLTRLRVLMSTLARELERPLAEQFSGKPLAAADSFVSIQWTTQARH